MPWSWPENESEVCWWVANFGEADKTKDVKLICQSMAVTRMLLHRARLATSSKLRAEWDRRLDNNSIASDVLSSNRELWASAGGPNPESLLTPTESALDLCAKTVVTLQAMLAKHGPQGGLDSFVQDPFPSAQHTGARGATQSARPRMQHATRTLRKPSSCCAS